MPTLLYKHDASIHVLTKAGEEPVEDADILCLWSTGIITNRNQVLDALEVNVSLPDKKLLELAYEKWQESSFALIHGSCSWLILDHQQRALKAIVGRSGAFPLYYRKVENGFLISNQAESLRTGRQWNVDHESIQRYLSVVPLPETSTYIEGMSTIPAGDYVAFSGNRPDHRRYSNLQPLIREYKDIDECANALRKELFKTVSQYLTDSPCAIAISSGLDSTSIAVAIRTMRPDIQLLGCIWRRADGADSGEADMAIRVCDHLGLEKVIIDDDSKGPFVDGLHQPCDSPKHNLFYGAFWGKVYQELQRRDVKVLFTGAGGDELFGANFFIYPDLFLQGKWLSLWQQLGLTNPRTTRDWAQRVWRLTLAPIFSAYLPTIYGNFFRHPKWLTFNPLKKPPIEESSANTRNMSFSRRQRYRLLCSLNRHGGYTVDLIDAARFGVSVRKPLLDHQLKEFALSIPSEYLCTGEGMKLVLRRAMMHDLPEEITRAPRKRLPSKFVHSTLVCWGEERIRELLVNMRCAEQGWVNEAAVRAEYDRFVNFVKNNSKCRKNIPKAGQLLRLLYVETWLRRYW